MKIQVLKDMMIGRQTYHKNDVIELKNKYAFQYLNDEYYILVLNGIRYDIRKEDIHVIE